MVMFVVLVCGKKKKVNNDNNDKNQSSGTSCGRIVAKQAYDSHLQPFSD
jgi:hypothetical protein